MFDLIGFYFDLTKIFIKKVICYFNNLKNFGINYIFLLKKFSNSFDIFLEEKSLLT